MYCLCIPDTGRQSGLEPSEYIITCKLISGRTQPCCSGKFQNPAMLRSYSAQYCNSVPQICTVVNRLVTNQKNWKCIACTYNSLLFNGYRGSLPGRNVDHRHLVPPPHMLSWRGQRQVYLFTSSNVHRLWCLQEFRGKRCEANHSCLSVPRLWTNEIIHSLFHVPLVAVLR